MSWGIYDTKEAAILAIARRDCPQWDCPQWGCTKGDGMCVVGSVTGNDAPDAMYPCPVCKRVADKIREFSRLTPGETNPPRPPPSNFPRPSGPPRDRHHRD